MNAPDPAVEDLGLPCGSHHDRILDLFTGRGWVLDFGDLDEGLEFDYPPSLGAAIPDPTMRLLLREDFGAITLSCTVRPDLRVMIVPCGVTGGCPEHRADTVGTDLDSPELPTILAAHERAAREMDRAILADCVLFGECSRLAGQSG